MNLESLLTGLAGGLIPSIGVLFISHKLLPSQKWWEKKSDEYLRIVKELAEFQNCAYKWQEHTWNQIEEQKPKTFSKEQIDQLLREDRTTRESIRKIAMAGSILISKEASVALEDLLKKTNEIDNSIDEGDPLELVDQQYELLKETISKIRECAKKDLGVK